MPGNANRVQDAAKRAGDWSWKDKRDANLDSTASWLANCRDLSRGASAEPADLSGAARRTVAGQARVVCKSGAGSASREATRAGRGEIAGRTVPIRVGNEGLSFEFAGRRRRFCGELKKDGAGRISGRLDPAGNVVGGPFASPVVLSKVASDDWRGETDRAARDGDDVLSGGKIRKTTARSAFTCEIRIETSVTSRSPWIASSATGMR